MRDVIISHMSFNEVLKNVIKNDLVYFDPPYYPLNATSSFTAYSESDFLDGKQKELFDVFEVLDKKGCFVFHSNSDTEFIKNIYKKYDISFVEANRFINSDSDCRGKIN